jgi:TPR repeat protein
MNVRTEGISAFVSYAHEDRAIAHEVGFHLQRRGCKVWIDAGELRAGDSLVQRLAEAIVEVDYVIPIVSEHSVRSSWCSKELSWAMTDEVNGLGNRFGVRRILPLRVGDVAMPLELRDKLYREVSPLRPGDVVPVLWEDIAGSGPASTGDESGVEQAYVRGRNLYDKGEVVAAKRHLHTASQQSHHGAALLLGEILCDEGELAAAADELQFAAGCEDLEVANTAITKHGRLLAMAEASAESGLGGRKGVLIDREFHRAAEMWQRAAESGHRDAAWAWVGLGRLRQDGIDPEMAVDLSGAEDAFRRAVQSGHAESHPYAVLRLGLVLEQLGSLVEARAVLEIGAVSRHRDWAPRCQFHLGCLYGSRQEDEQARHWLYEAANSGHPGIERLAEATLRDLSSLRPSS